MEYKYDCDQPTSTFQTNFEHGKKSNKTHVDVSHGNRLIRRQQCSGAAAAVPRERWP